MTSIKQIIPALLVVVSYNALAEPEFAVTREGNEFLFDYVSEPKSDITALGFRVDIGDLDPDAIDLSKCTVGLPSTHVGFCKANPGFVKVLVYSNDNSILGTTHIGSISVESTVASSHDRRAALSEGRRNLSTDRGSVLRGGEGSPAGLDQVKVRNLNYSDTNANDIKGKVFQ